MRGEQFVQKKTCTPRFGAAPETDVSPSRGHSAMVPASEATGARLLGSEAFDTSDPRLSDGHPKWRDTRGLTRIMNFVIFPDALLLDLELCGKNVARQIQLMLNYEPKPPFDLTVDNAPASLLAAVRASAASSLQEGRRLSGRGGARLRGQASILPTGGLPQ